MLVPREHRVATKSDCLVWLKNYMNAKSLLNPSNDAARRRLCDEEEGGFYILNLKNPFMLLVLLDSVYFKAFWRPRSHGTYEELASYNIQYRTSATECDEPYWEEGHGQSDHDPWNEVKKRTN